MLVVVTARIPPSGVRAFAAYEDAVLPLLAHHGAVLERRLRTPDGTREVHVLRFPDRAALEAYDRDPRRQSHTPLLAASGAAVDVLLDVEDAAT